MEESQIPMEDNKEESDLTWVFCYGSNHPEQISRRLKVPLAKVLEKCRACSAKGYIRAFMGISKKWDETSPSTIIKSTNKARLNSPVLKDSSDEFKAFAYGMTSEELSMMDKWEGVPFQYKREEITLTGKDGVEFEGLAYIKVSDERFVYPSEKYLEACGKTIMAYWYLPPKTSESDIKSPTESYFSVGFEVVNATTGEKEGEYESKISYDQDTCDYILNDLYD
ncbi:unnamed protein product [Moneuplotes crassus]|uniref:Gamma-glutamylcyclotransferase AIG2-like domain-containing protein n=1 Tax=Euplotes crassus TaxID=5936 RepID=A0AAD1XXY7_EUPCR|nr:unnamed protein product [Moneuplotes crassus]